jgi:hypothetical protein
LLVLLRLSGIKVSVNSFVSYWDVTFGQTDLQANMTKLFGGFLRGGGSFCAAKLDN